MTTTYNNKVSFLATVSEPVEKNFQKPKDTSRRSVVIKWISVAVSVYLLITAVNLISAGFSLTTGDSATTLFSYVDNVFVALSIGILATVLTQSSSTTTSITVGFVASGMPLAVAIPVLLGANIGTTVTNTLVALAAVPERKGDRETFRRSFSAASVHDFFNVLAVSIFLPLELIFGLLERVSGYFASVFEQANGGAENSSSLLIEITNVISSIFSALADFMLSFMVIAEENTTHGMLNGIVLLVLALALLVFSIRFISKTLGDLLVGKAKKALYHAISHNSFTGVLSGAVITSAVQSSSTTTSLAVPLVGTGSFSLKQIYPFMVGANIGTTVTALLVGITMVGGGNAEFGILALQAALVHTFFNIFAAILIMLTPVIKKIPIYCAELIGELAVKHRLLAVGYTVSMFIVIPAIVLLISILVFS